MLKKSALTCLTSLLTFLVLSTTCWAQYSGQKLIRIGVLYNNTPTGERHLSGVNEALKSHPIKDLVKIKEFSYISEQQGLERLRKILIGQEVDIVLGPTESGVFVRGWEQREELSENQIPVISSLVTADISNEPSGWFFRTNVDVRLRARAIYDFLNKYWIKKITILYADTEFGRRAEDAFRTALSSQQQTYYTAFPFERAQDTRSELREILDKRPEAVGIFSEREEIEIIYDSLKAMNSRGSRFNPFFFTVIDARETMDTVDDIYFVSVTSLDSTAAQNGAAHDYDDVKALAYDTMTLVLNELQKMPRQPLSRQREAFRDRFVNVLAGKVKKVDTDTKTDMKFADNENSAPRKIFHLKNGTLTEEDPNQVVSFTGKLKKKYDLLFELYGWWPMFLTFLILIVVAAVISGLDLQRWYGRNWLKLFIRPSYFHLLILVNIFLSVGIFIVLAELGQIRYDSMIMAFIIAVSPPTFLKATVFELPTGQSIGFAKTYDRFLLWINDKLMIRKAKMMNTRVNIMAYYNSFEGMKTQLKEIFENAPNEKQQARLIAELEESLQKATSDPERRRICARRLLRKLEWEELKLKGFVPKDVNEEEDPATRTREIARYCINHPESMKQLRHLIKQHLEEADDSTEVFYNRKINEAKSQWDKLFYEVQFVRFVWGYNDERLKEAKIIDDSEIKAAKSVNQNGNDKDSEKNLKLKKTAPPKQK